MYKILVAHLSDYYSQELFKYLILTLILANFGFQKLLFSLTKAGIMFN
jgi:hypothetical protein